MPWRSKWLKAPAAAGLGPPRAPSTAITPRPSAAPRPPPAVGPLALGRLHRRFGFLGAPDRLQPARRFRQGFTQIPDDERADAAKPQHRAPAEFRNHQ